MNWYNEFYTKVKLFLKCLIAEGIHDEEVIEMYFAPRVGSDDIFATRQGEDHFRILITNHLLSDDTVLRVFQTFSLCQNVGLWEKQ